jgi:NAD(P)-dependent dehydrogenase (short-subunit alcohol dehydrogenase family)
VVGSFSRLGPAVRRVVAGWSDDDRALEGRTVVLTGGTSGIGLAIARRCALAGARVHLLARDAARATSVADALPGCHVSFGIADLSDPGTVRRFALDATAELGTVDVLVHNAGALHRRLERTTTGDERTLATQLLAPFLLTSLLLPALRGGGAGPGRVLTMSSGGMYTQRFELDALDPDPSDYSGPVTYARVKRAQVVLTGEWARRVPRAEVAFHALHPGWVDTPGIRAGLPGFARFGRILFRSPDDGADTAVWLSHDPEALRTSGDFWLDRRRRGLHRLPWTRGGDDPARLWDRCEAWARPWLPPEARLP